MEEEGQLSDDSGQNKFTNLCSELECALANSYTALDEVIALKDIMLECNLPSAMKVKLTLAVGRLHRSMSDLSVPTGEMTRLVRLYAVPWENKSKALKKLHQDYESKQHKLEIALRRLELIGVQTMRMEKERRIMNWEKLFAKLVGGKGHGQRWRFFIYQFKQKLKKGEDISAFYSAISDEESDSNAYESEKNGEGKRNTLFAQEFEEKIEKYGGLGQSLTGNRSDLHADEEHKIGGSSMIEEESEASINVAASEDNVSTVGAEAETPGLTQQMKKKVRFDGGADFQEDIDGEFQSKALECQKELSDKVCWTHEPEYENFFNIRVYAPNCKTLESSWCTVVFDNEIRRSQLFNVKKEEQVHAEEKQPERGNSKGTVRREKSSANKGQEKNENNVEFQEFSFKLLKDFDSRNKEEIILKFSVHPAKKKKMVAMTTINLSNVAVFDEVADGSTLSSNEMKPTSYQIKATVNNSELIFNKACGEIHILCFYSKVILPFTISRGTETLSIDELTNNIIELRKKEFFKRLKSAGTTMTEKPIYTEEQMLSAKEELKTQLRTLRDEYEERLTLIISQLNKENNEDLREFVNAATSPLFMWSESETKLDSQQGEEILVGHVPPPKPKLPKKPLKQKSGKKQKVWGQNLPEHFYERMEMFKEESSKYHRNLKEKINDEVGKEIEKKLASSNKLARSPKDATVSEDVCLPALYMPTKTRNLYTPKARSYFHAFGTYQDRLTQAPSILELPKLRHDNTDIVGIYETVMKQKMDNLPDRENDTDFGRLSPESSTSIEIAGLENNEDEEEA